MLHKRYNTPYKRYIVVLSFASQAEFWTIQSRILSARLQFNNSWIVPHWSASLRLSCVYCARRKHTNWAVYCCSTKDSILGHVNVSQELSIFHASVVHFHSVFNFRITLSQADESSSVSLERDYEPVFIHQFQVPWDTAKVSGGHGSMSVKVFLAICCSFFCSVAVSVRADLPEYCGPQNYAYTPLRKDPRGEFTLKQVHVVIRFVASDVQNNMCYVNFYSS